MAQSQQTQTHGGRTQLVAAKYMTPEMLGLTPTQSLRQTVPNHPSMQMFSQPPGQGAPPGTYTQSLYDVQQAAANYYPHTTQQYFPAKHEVKKRPNDINIIDLTIDDEIVLEDVGNNNNITPTRSNDSSARETPQPNAGVSTPDNIMVADSAIIIARVATEAQDRSPSAPPATVVSAVKEVVKNNSSVASVSLPNLVSQPSKPSQQQNRELPLPFESPQVSVVGPQVLRTPRQRRFSQGLHPKSPYPSTLERPSLEFLRPTNIYQNKISNAMKIIDSIISGQVKMVKYRNKITPTRNDSSARKFSQLDLKEKVDKEHVEVIDKDNTKSLPVKDGSEESLVVEKMVPESAVKRVIRYSRDFLLSLKNKPQSKIKPENLPDVISLLRDTNFMDLEEIEGKQPVEVIDKDNTKSLPLKKRNEKPFTIIQKTVPQSTVKKEAKKYSRDFLLGLKNKPESQIKPANLPDVISTTRATNSILRTEELEINGVVSRSLNTTVNDIDEKIHSIIKDRIKEIEKEKKQKQSEIKHQLSHSNLQGNKKYEGNFLLGLRNEPLSQLEPKIISDSTEIIKESHMEPKVCETLEPHTAQPTSCQKSMNKVQEELTKLMKEKKPYGRVLDFILNNVGDRVKDLNFIHALTTAICEACISDTDCGFDKINFKRYEKLVKRFLKNNNEYEKECFNAIRSLVVRLEQPDGLMDSICNLFVESNVVTSPVFKLKNCEKMSGNNEGSLANTRAFFSGNEEGLEDNKTVAPRNKEIKKNPVEGSQSNVNSVNPIPDAPPQDVTQALDSSEAFGRLCAAELRQLKLTENKQKFKRLVMEVICNIADADALGKVYTPEK